EAPKAAEPTKPAAPASPAASPAAGASPAASPAAAAQTGPAPVARKGSTLRILQWSHFVPAYDKWIDDWVGQWGQKNGVDAKLDHINTDQLPARIAAEASAGAGHDIIQFQGVVQ